MFKTALTSCLIIISASAQASSMNDPLALDLEQYIAAFDVSELGTDARNDVRTILDADGASHADKVFALHDILRAEGALVHVDMHDATAFDTAENR